MAELKPNYVLILNGSPRRKGNCSILVDSLMRGITENGGNSGLIRLQELKIAPCNACDSCRRNDTKSCVINDDMTPLYEKVEKSDAIVFASPTYWFNISAQLKLFVDRMYAFGFNEYQALRGKKIGIIMTFADKDVFSSGCVNALRSFEDIFNYLGSKIVGAVYGSAENPGDIKNHPEIIKEAYELGKKILKE